MLQPVTTSPSGLDKIMTQSCSALMLSDSSLHRVGQGGDLPADRGQRAGTGDVTAVSLAPLLRLCAT